LTSKWDNSAWSHKVKNFQKKFNDQMIMNSFILSCTDEKDLINHTGTKEELEDMHVLFMDDTGPVYLEKLFDRILASM